MNDPGQHKLIRNFWFATAALGIGCSLYGIFELLDRHYFGFRGWVYVDEEKPYLKLAIFCVAILMIIMVTWLRKYPPVLVSIAGSTISIIVIAVITALGPAAHFRFTNTVVDARVVHDAIESGKPGSAISSVDTVPRTTRGR